MASIPMVAAAAPTVDTMKADSSSRFKRSAAEPRCAPMVESLNPPVHIRLPPAAIGTGHGTDGLRQWQYEHSQYCHKKIVTVRDLARRPMRRPIHSSSTRNSEQIHTLMPLFVHSSPGLW